MTILFLFCLTTVFASPSLIEYAKYTKTNMRVFDDIYSAGIWDLHFNESLYIHSGFGSSACFNNTNCRSSQLACDPCDWTNPGICNGTLRPANSSCPCINPPLLCRRNLWPNDNLAWSNTQQEIVVEIRKGLVDISFHPNPPNNCSCIIFRFDVLEGFLEGMQLYYGETWFGSDGTEYIISRHGTATICPSDPRWGQTHIVRLISSFSKAIYAKVRVSVVYRNVTSTFHSPVCTVPTKLVSSHSCIPTNVLTRVSPLSGQTYLRVVIDPPANYRCGVIGFWASSVEHLLSTNPYVSPENSTDAFRTHRESSPDGRLWPSLYPYCLKSGEKLYAFVLSSTPVDFFVDVTKEWMLLRPFTDYAPPDFYKKLLGSIEVSCPSRNYIAHRTTFAISEDVYTGSANLRAVYPSDDVDLFYPAPFFANEPYNSLTSIPLASMSSNRLIVSLFLSQKLAKRTQPLAWKRPWFPTSISWLDEVEFSSCVLKVGGVIADSQGNSLNLVLNVPSVNPISCNYSNYYTASSQMQSLSQSSIVLANNPNVALTDIYRLWFLQDRISTSNDFYFCRRYAESYYLPASLPDKILTTSSCLADFNSTNFTSDACCAFDINTLYSNCLPQSRSLTDQITVDSYTSSLDDCVDNTCTRSSLVNLVTLLNDERNPDACTNFVDRVDDEDVYWRCVNSIWGPETVTFAGPSCISDSDCASGICNVYSSRCLVNVADGEKALIECIYANLTQFTRTFVTNNLNINTTTNITTAWQNAFSDILPCSDPYTPVGFDLDWTVTSNCQGCNGFAINTTNYAALWHLSPGASWPQHGFGCWAPGSSSCSVVALKFAGKSYCGMAGCNFIPYNTRGYFPYISSPALCSNRSFCGVSDDGFFSREVDIPLSSCDNATACFLVNNTVIVTSNASECISIYSCTSSVENAVNGITDEIGCNNSGICTDSTDYDIGIWTGIYADEVAGCFFDIRYLQPFNPTVSICEAPFRNTILGCSVYPGPSGMRNGLFAIDPVSCVTGNFSWGDPTIFKLSNPRWITKATSKSSCLSMGSACIGKTKIGAVPSYTNVRDNTCTNPTPLFKWIPGRWLPGQPRIAKVTVGKLGLRFAPVPRSGLVLPRILSNITKAVDKLQSLKTQSSAFCRNSYKIYLDSIICSCIGQYNESFCYDKSTLNVTSIGVVCDEATNVTSEDLTLALTATSLPPSSCQSLFLTSFSILSYANRDIIPLRTLLVNYAEDSAYAIRNSQSAIYGKVLTNGYSVNFTLPVSNLQFCISISEFRKDYALEREKYSIYDLAKRPLDSNIDDLIPMYVNVTIEGDIFCSSLDVLEKNTIYYFVERVDSPYDVVKREVFTSGEVAYISVLLALYCIGLICSVIKLGYVIIGYWENIPLRLTIVVSCIATFFLFRVVLFSLLLNQSLLSLTTTRAVNYLLFEFPIILYFAFVTNYVCIWFTSILIIKDFMPNYKRNLTLANYISIALNVFIFMMFIIFIILFETIVFPPKVICGGEIVLFDSTSFTLLLIYRIIFSSIAIILGLLLFLVAMRFGRYLSDPSFNIEKAARYKLYILSIVGGLGLIGQAIYFLVITASQTTPINYASLTILLVLEIIPALTFIFIESVRANVSMSGTGSTKSRSRK